MEKVTEMVTVSINHDLSRLTENMRYAQRRHVPIAAAKALTAVAENARQDAAKEMRDKLHAPTSYTLNSMFKTPANYRNWPNLEATVHVKGWERLGGSRGRSKGSGSQADVLGHLFSGGARRWKGFETALMRAGLLPRGMAAVPGDGAPLNANGNIPAGFLKQMVSYFGAAERYAGHTANMTDKGRERFGKKKGKTMGIGGAAVEFFVSRGKGNWFGRRSWKHGRMQHLLPGIWMRARSAGGTALKPVIMFVKQPRYQRYFDLEQIARTAIRRDFDREFGKAFEQALATSHYRGAWR